MSKTTFYMVIFVMVVLDIVQSRYKRKLIAMERARQMS
jgi:DNA-directed RNA polymerase subunit K/omega